MTLRQSILKVIYPLWMWYSRNKENRKKILQNRNNVQPVHSFYSLAVRLNNNTELNFDSLKGKKVLLVNTASDCGYTNQYDDLQKLFETTKDKLIVIGFPANDFKEQEKGNEIFKWLSDKNENGWNNKQPSWNFSKYLVNEQGLLTHYFDPAISPLS